MQESVKPQFGMHLRVYWEDTDAGGIVYHSNYVKFMERARSEWLRSKGLGQQQAREQLGGMFVVTNLSLRYLQPARLDDWLWVTASVVERGRASMTMSQTVFRQESDSESGTLLCDAHVRIGWVNSQTVRAGRIPENVHNLFI